MRLVLPPAGAGALITRLPDGRRLAHAEWGDPDGRPVLHMHGLPGSRLEIHADPEFYVRSGVRLVTVDRPGYGLSDPDPRGTLLSWAADVEVLVGELGLQRFGVTPGQALGIPADRDPPHGRSVPRPRRRHRSLAAGDPPGSSHSARPAPHLRGRGPHGHVDAPRRNTGRRHRERR